MYKPSKKREITRNTEAVNRSIQVFKAPNLSVGVVTLPQRIPRSQVPTGQTAIVSKPSSGCGKRGRDCKFMGVV